MSENPHFASAASWTDAAALLAFRPLEPAYTAGFALQSLRIHIRDHKLRDVPVDARALEAHYGAFVFSQSRHAAHEARRLALDVSYGRESWDAAIAGRAGRAYDLGPEPAPDDVDGRSPAVVVWHDGEMFYLVASGDMRAHELIPIAVSVHATKERPRS